MKVLKNMFLGQYSINIIGCIIFPSAQSTPSYCCPAFEPGQYHGLMSLRCQDASNKALAYVS